MSEPHAPPPKVAVKERKGISMVWIIPLVAAAIAGWLIYSTFAEKGPTITITFKTAEGLEAGKTKVRYKDIEVGTVSALRISDDLSKVLVTADLDKELEKHLNERTRFWVVRPRLTAAGVSGLSTLVSGAYIEMDPAQGPAEKAHLRFEGLEEPPQVTSEDAGREFVLEAPTLGSIGTGSAIVFRGINVGEVLGYRLSEDNSYVEITIFVKSPHDDLIRPGTRFWNASGISASLNAEGVKIAVESLQTLVTGGISFETPPWAMTADPSPADSRFRLYESYELQEDQLYSKKIAFVAYFDGSVRGLSPGAPVEFRGIRVGTVSDVHLEFNEETLEARIPVIFELEPERLRGIGQSGPEDPYEVMAALIENGMRAQLQSGNILTGQLLVDLTVYPDAEPAELILGGTYPEMPTVPAELDRLARSLNGILEKVAALPMEEIANDLRKNLQALDKILESPEIPKAIASLDETLTAARGLVTQLEARSGPLLDSLRTTSDRAGEAIADTEKIIGAVDEILGPDSATRYNLVSMMAELSQAARSIRILTDYLEQHPEALVRGKGGFAE